MRCPDLQRADHRLAHRCIIGMARATVYCVLGLTLLAPRVLAADGPLKVLVIDSERGDLPLWVEFSTAFKSALRTGSERPVDTYFENLDCARLGDGGYLDRAALWLKEKYRDIRPDVIVTIGPETYRLMTRRQDLFRPETSLVFVAVDSKTFEGAGSLPRSTGLLRNFGQIDTARIALELLPETRHLAIVGGPADPQSYSRFFRSQIVSAYGEKLDIIDLCGLPLDEMRSRVTRLPEDTVIILTAMAVDGDGRPVTHPEVVAAIAPVSNAPMFGSIKTELGHGTVGGSLFDSGMSGRQTAALVARILNGEPAESIAPRLTDISVVAFDWRELRRWGIPERRLPPGSVVEFRPPTLWEEHKAAMLAGITVIGLQSVLIMALVRARERRKRANRELHRLSGRLITAQEDERRRVARELHDDVSQRLALLALELESPGVEEKLSTTSAKVQELARDVHAIAHHLQPPRLEGENLGRELEAFCAEVSSRHELRVDCRVSERETGLQPHQLLALYRVAQEAVQNAVKHSGADEVSVELGVSPRWVSITVSDTGQGFDGETTGEHRGVGLAGMRERMKLVGGWLNIDSAPGVGTTVGAWVPLEPQSKGEEP